MDWKAQGLKEGACCQCGTAILRYRVIPGLRCDDCKAKNAIVGNPIKAKKYYHKNRTKLHANVAKWRTENPGSAKEINRRHSQTVKAKQTRAKYLTENADSVKQKKADWHKRTWAARGDTAKLHHQEWYRNGGLAVMKIRHAERYASDVGYKLKFLLRNRLRDALKGRKKSAATLQLLGCSLEFFKGYIEGKFKAGMNWNNWNTYGWHLDHVRPLATFDLADTAQISTACHYTNLQPLWREENLKKGARLA